MGVIGFIKEQIKALGLSYSQIEKATGIPSEYLSRILNGHTSPSAEKIDLLLRVVGVDFNLSRDNDSIPVVGELDYTEEIEIYRKPINVNFSFSPDEYGVRCKWSHNMSSLPYTQNFILCFNKQPAELGGIANITIKINEKLKSFLRFYLPRKDGKVELRPYRNNIETIIVEKKDIIFAHRLTKIIRKFT